MRYCFIELLVGFVKPILENLYLLGVLLSLACRSSCSTLISLPGAASSRVYHPLFLYNLLLNTLHFIVNLLVQRNFSINFVFNSGYFCSVLISRLINICHSFLILAVLYGLLAVLFVLCLQFFYHVALSFEHLL